MRVKTRYIPVGFQDDGEARAISSNVTYIKYVSSEWQQQSQSLKSNGYIGIFLLLYLTISLLLTACHSSKPIPAQALPSQTLVLSIAKNNGMTTIQQGSRLLISIPTDTFFMPLTTQLNPCKINVLLKMASCLYQYSSYYPFSNVYVRGYTDRFFPPYRQQNLSQEYADVIAAYLWNAGIPNSHVIAEGFGSNYPIASYKTVSGKGFNRRVEIQIN